MMIKSDINKLAIYSPHIKWLLDNTPQTTSISRKHKILKAVYTGLLRMYRGDTKIIYERYIKDKYDAHYAKLLEAYERNPNLSGQELMDIGSGNVEPEKEVCISMGDDLWITTEAIKRKLTKERILVRLLPYMTESQAVIELGCAFGHNLWLLRDMSSAHRFIGGELSQYAVSLGQRLFRDCPDISMEQFNFYDEDWSIFENIEGKSLVYTCHAIEQLPSAKNVINNLIRYHEKITYVAHLEPILELYGSATLLDLLRQRYARASGYNTDLLTCIKSTESEVIKIEKDIMGSNPLNPTSLLVWKPQSNIGGKNKTT